MTREKRGLLSGFLQSVRIATGLPQEQDVPEGFHMQVPAARRGRPVAAAAVIKGGRLIRPAGQKQSRHRLAAAVRET